jgi:hypothetical protein
VRNQINAVGRHEMRPDRFGTFLVRAVYVAAGFCAAWPVIGLIADPGDPGHLERFLLCIPAALGIAVVGKLLWCLIVIAHGRSSGACEQRASPDGEDTAAAP